MKQKVKKPLPHVVLVGRPNVGKSSLFNALLQRRRSITDPTRGVTRDPISEVYSDGDFSFSLLDTGGFTLDKDEMSSLIREKTLSAVALADLIIFIIDVMEWTGEDKEFLDWLRPYSDKLILVVNKVDSPKRMDRFYEFLGMGISEVLPVSASHLIGIGDLRDKIKDRLEILALTSEDIPEEYKEDSEQEEFAELREGDTRIKIAIVGKPNAGKSTLINHLSGKEVSIVSSIAGTTRDVVKTEFKHGKTWYEVWDTAGIRRKSKVGDSVEYYSVHRAIDSLTYADVVYLLIDSQEDLSAQDKKIAYQIVKRGKPIIICFSKWDLLIKEKNLLEAMTDRLHFLFPILEFAPVVPISSLEGEGFEELFKKTHRAYKELHTKLETPRLNDSLKTWAADYPPPRPFKVKFLTQVSTDPVKFVLFVNRSQDFPSSYVSYIKNKIRSIGPAHIPFQLEVKSSQ